MTKLENVDSSEAVTKVSFFSSYRLTSLAAVSLQEDAPQQASGILPARPLSSSILCVGDDPMLLATRCAVLNQCGYRAAFTSTVDVISRLRDAGFELVVLSQMLSNEERTRLQAAVPSGTKVLELERLVWPEELERLVAEALK